MPDWVPVNWPLLKNPVNWLIVLFMVILAMLPIMFVSQRFSATQ